jgi:hypothetical protein
MLQQEKRSKGERKCSSLHRARWLWSSPFECHQPLPLIDEKATAELKGCRALISHQDRNRIAGSMLEGTRRKRAHILGSSQVLRPVKEKSSASSD